MRGSLVEKSGSWYARVELGKTPDGKRKQKWIKLDARGKREAEKMLPAVVQSAINEEIPVSDDRMTLEQYLTKWLETYAKINTRRSTYVTYEWAAKNHIIPEMGRQLLSKIRPMAIQSLYSKKTKELSSTSVSYIHRVLSQSLKHAVKWQLLTRNPCDAVEPPRKNAYKAQVYSVAQMSKLLAGLKGERTALPVTLAVTCGLRRGEVCALRWQDVDLEKGEAFIQNNLGRVDSKLTLLPVKTDKSARRVKLPQVALAALKAEQVKQAADRLRIGRTNYQEEGFCWAWEDGLPYDPDLLYKWFRKLCDDLELPAIRFHDLRHSHATMLLMQNVPIKVISERLGHSTTAFTQDIYSHVLPQMQQQAANRVDDAFAPKKKKAAK